MQLNNNLYRRTTQSNLAVIYVAVHGQLDNKMRVYVSQRLAGYKYEKYCGLRCSGQWQRREVNV
jgi:hypothetical protein